MVALRPRIDSLSINAKGVVYCICLQSLPLMQVIVGAYTNPRKCADITQAVNTMVESGFVCP